MKNIILIITFILTSILSMNSQAGLVYDIFDNGTGDNLGTLSFPPATNTNEAVMTFNPGIIGTTDPLEFSFDPNDSIWVIDPNLWEISSFISGGFNGFTPQSSPLDSTIQQSLSARLNITNNLGTLEIATADFILPAFNVTLTSVPIPAAVWLFATSLIGLLSIKKRRYYN